MSDLIVTGGTPINGIIKPSGNKNAVLPMLCASLLTTEEVILENVPDISDIEKLLEYFRGKGSVFSYDRANHNLAIRHDPRSFVHNGANLPMGIRAAVLLMAPTIIRTGKLRFDIESKGCALGVREIDPHVEILKFFGCKVLSQRPCEIEAPIQFRGARIWPDYASVTATETFIMLASAVSGESIMQNAASEPHVQALCEMLTAMGARIEGAGTSRLKITGAERLAGGRFRVPDDHHEVATFLAIAGVTGGNLKVETDCTEHLDLILRQFGKLGLEFSVEQGGVSTKSWSRQITEPFTPELVPKIEAAPWPYFPADLLPQAIGVSVGCNGNIMFWNKIYEGALGWTAELHKFGARVHQSDPHRLVVFGGNQLRPATVEAPYIIRVVVALLVAAIQIKGTSRIQNADPLRRAYPDFVEKLTRLGANVRWDRGLV